MTVGHSWANVLTKGKMGVACKRITGRAARNGGGGVLREDANLCEVMR
jgi:hypothetical protein